MGYEVPIFLRELETGFSAAMVFNTTALIGGCITGDWVLVIPKDQQLRCALHPGALSPVANKWGHRGWTTLDLGGGNPAFERFQILSQCGNTRR